MKLAIIPEGPMAFDGENYLYSEGEGVYIDSIAKHFDEVIVCAYVFKPGDAWYDSVSHYCFESPNVRFVELPLIRSRKPSVLLKLLQFIRVGAIVLSNLRKWDMLYLFIPGYPSAITHVLNRFFRRPYFIYAASDWSQSESELIFRWEGIVKRLLFPLYHRLNSFLEKDIVSNALFALSAGRQCRVRHGQWSDKVYETIPRINWKGLTLYERSDTCQSSPIALLYVGGMYERKGLTYLLRAVSLLRKRATTNIVLRMVGGGEQKSQLEGLTKDLGVKDVVEFMGHVPNGPELFNIYKTSDLFVFPSLGEGFPRVLYEAMLHGLPIITTRVSGIPYYVPHEERALLVPPKDPAAIAGAIERVINEQELRKRMIRHGIEFMRSVLRNSDGGKQIQQLLAKHYRSC